MYVAVRTLLLSLVINLSVSAMSTVDLCLPALEEHARVGYGHACVHRGQPQKPILSSVHSKLLCKTFHAT